MKPPETTLRPQVRDPAEVPSASAALFAPIDQSTLPEHHRWKGPGPMPARWTAADGTIVYRSYADYCDD